MVVKNRKMNKTEDNIAILISIPSDTESNNGVNTPPRREEINELARIAALNINSSTKTGSDMTKIAQTAAVPIYPFIYNTPALTVFIASLAAEPINGIIFAVAKRIVLMDVPSRLIASVPLSAISATRREKRNTTKETKFFFNDLVSPNVGIPEKTCSETIKATKIKDRGEMIAKKIFSITVNIMVSEDVAASEVKGWFPNNITADKEASSGVVISAMSFNVFVVVTILLYSVLITTTVIDNIGTNLKNTARSYAMN